MARRPALQKSYPIRLGDCLDPTWGMASLPDVSVDHVVADPPYDDRVHASGALPRGKVLAFDPLSPQQMDELALQYARLARRWVLIFCAAEMAGDWARALRAVGLQAIRTGAWVKTDAAPQLTGDRPSAGHEAIVIAHRPGRKRWNGGGKAAVWTGPSREGGVSRWHPAQKPLWLMEALLRDFTEPGDLVLDSHSGSGSTGVACKRLGRLFVGWEINPVHQAVAERRIEQTREQIEIPVLASKPKQEALL